MAGDGAGATELADFCYDMAADLDDKYADLMALIDSTQD